MWTFYKVPGSVTTTKDARKSVWAHLVFIVRFSLGELSSGGPGLCFLVWT